jgi:hypothetical protein
MLIKEPPECKPHDKGRSTFILLQYSKYKTEKIELIIKAKNLSIFPNETIINR